MQSGMLQPTSFEGVGSTPFMLSARALLITAVAAEVLATDILLAPPLASALCSSTAVFARSSSYCPTGGAESTLLRASS